MTTQKTDTSVVDGPPAEGGGAARLFVEETGRPPRGVMLPMGAGVRVKSASVIAPGTELDGRYRILRLHSEGGMGAVYEAEHVVVGRRVAIKVLHAHFAQVPGAVRRFAREARAAAEIGHANIVNVLDAGTHDGLPFLVMELLRGETLGERIARGPTIETREACSIIGQVLSALASTHAKGIIHRDLKPDNVFLADQGGEVVVKLLDFGVSKFRPSSDAIHETTQEGLPIGTPAYMAPEQWMGGRDIDHRADLFATGVILYEMLTGGMPYEGTSQGELFLEIVRGTEAPPAPSAIAPGTPEAIDAAVLRGVARDRDARFPSARDFLESLRPFGADADAVTDLPRAPDADDAGPTHARAALRAATRVVHGTRRAGAATWGAALVIVALIGLVTGRSWPRTSPPSSVTTTRPRTAPADAAPPPAPPLAEGRRDDVAPLPDARPHAPTAQSSRDPARRRTHATTRARATPTERRGRPGVLRISHEF